MPGTVMDGLHYIWYPKADILLPWLFMGKLVGVAQILTISTPGSKMENILKLFWPFSHTEWTLMPREKMGGLLYIYRQEVDILTSPRPFSRMVLM
jgi:hypothetical protein